MGKIKKTLTTVGLGLSGLALYVHFIEKRSIQSFIHEKQLRWSGAKQRFEEKNLADFEAQLEEAAALSRQPYPNPSEWVGMPVEEVSYEGMQTFIWNDKHDPNQRVLIFWHGGAYLYQAKEQHFKTVAKLAEALDAKVVFPIYPKVPDHTYREAYLASEALYRDILAQVNDSQQISFIGVSAGAGLALGFAMYARDQRLPQPKDILLISAWLDVRLSHPDIPSYEAVDPSLSAWGMRKIGKLWAGNRRRMKHPDVSPIYGDFDDLGRITLFIGTHDILYPENEQLHQMLEEIGIAHDFIVKDKMNHVYPMMPIPEAKEAQAQIIEQIKH